MLLGATKGVGNARRRLGLQWWVPNRDRKQGATTAGQISIAKTKNEYEARKSLERYNEGVKLRGWRTREEVE
jgi:hypothetical protein